MRRAVLALLLAAAPGPAETTGDFAGVPGVTVTYYSVAGADADGLRAALDAAGPREGTGGDRVDALTHWRITWRWRGCNRAHATLRFAAEVTLPRLADPAALPPALLDQWQRYIAALEAHEAQHVRYAYDHRLDVLAAIRAAPCATAARAGEAALAAIRAHDVAFDRDTQHGRLQGAHFP